MHLSLSFSSPFDLFRYGENLDQISILCETCSSDLIVSSMLWESESYYYYYCCGCFIIIIIISLIAINTRRVYAKFRHNTGKGLNKKTRLLMSTLKADRMI